MTSRNREGFPVDYTPTDADPIREGGYNARRVIMAAGHPIPTYGRMPEAFDPTEWDEVPCRMRVRMKSGSNNQIKVMCECMAQTEDQRKQVAEGVPVLPVNPYVHWDEIEIVRSNDGGFEGALMVWHRHRRERQERIEQRRAQP